VSLTKKAQLFVMEFCANPEIGKAEAARRAGYSKNRAQIRACELMKNPEVQREIERHLNGKVKSVDAKPLSPETVIQDLDDIANMCRSAGAGAWQAATLVKVAELKGKYLKMFTDKVEVGPNDALMELLLEGRKRAGLASPQIIPALPDGGEGSVQ
jgi:hypothetical protein